MMCVYIVIITQVSAEDTETVGGMVRYELVNAIPFSAITQFSINRTTGELSLLQSLDREADSSITLVVAASDMGEPGTDYADIIYIRSQAILY